MPGLLSSRLGALCGVIFAVFAFFAVSSLETPKKATDQEVLDWWIKGSNQSTAIVSMFVMIAAAIALSIFLSAWRDRLASAGSPLANAAHAPGSAASIMLLVSAVVRGAVAMAVKVNGEPLPGIDVLRFTPILSRNVLEVACCALAISMLLTAWAVVRSAELPNWFGWTSAGLGVLSLALLPVVGPFVLPLQLLWAIVGSVPLWRVSAEVAASRRPAAALA